MAKRSETGRNKIGTTVVESGDFTRRIGRDLCGDGRNRGVSMKERELS